MNFQEKFDSAKESIKEFVKNNGAYLIEQIPFVGDYYCARELSRFWGYKEDDIAMCSTVGAMAGAYRTIPLAVGVLIGHPEVGVMINAGVGGVESVSTLATRAVVKSRYYHRLKKPQFNSLNEQSQIKP